MIDRKLVEESANIPIAQGGLAKIIFYLIDHIDSLERRIESLEKWELEVKNDEEF